MKTLLILLSLVFSSYLFSQNHNALIGTWQQQTGNEIFRIEIWREFGQYSDGTAKSMTLGHFQIIELNANGEETIVLDSDQIINPSNPNSHRLPPAISGGVYNSEMDYYYFFFTDVNGVMGDLRLKLVAPEGEGDGSGANLSQLKWDLRTGWYKGGELNVPEFAVLIKVE